MNGLHRRGGADNYNWVLRDRHFNVVDLGKTSQTRVEIRDLRTGDKYTFAVRSSRNLSISDYSQFIIGIPGGIYIPVEPDVPGGLECTEQGETSLTYKWNSVLDAKEYEYILQDDSKAVVHSGTVADTLVVFDDLTKGMIYFLKVKSLNDGKESEFSSKASGIAGGEYIADKLRLLFLSAPEGVLWKEGDVVRATVDGTSAEYVCEADNQQNGLFWLQDGSVAPDYGNAQVLFPADLTQIPSLVPQDYRLPLAAVSNGAQAQMNPLCGELTLSVVSDIDIDATKVELGGDGAFSGPCAVDWTGDTPVLVLSGDQGIGLDFSSAPLALGSEPVDLHIPVPVKEYCSVNVSVTAGEEVICSPVLGGVDVSKSSSASCILPDMDDFYSIWRSGNSFSICGEVISKASYPVAKTFSASSVNEAFEKGGLCFVDNSSESRVWNYSGARAKKMCAGTVMVGRFKSFPQPVIRQSFATDNQGCFYFDGDVKFLNYRIESKDNSYGVFQGKSGVANSGNHVFRFQDCTLINSKNYLISFNNGSYAVPKAMYFDNCIIRVKSMVVYGGSNTSNHPEKLETLSFKNTVIAPYSEDSTVSPTKTNGCLVNFGTTVSATTGLNIDMSYCTIYDYQPSIKTRGLIEVKDYANFSMDHIAFYHSSYAGFDSKYYTIYGLQTSTVQTGGIYVAASYSNTIEGQTMQHGTGNKSGLTPSPRSWQCTITSAPKTVDTDNMDPAKDYFPVSSGLDAGANYQSKYWINQ